MTDMNEYNVAIIEERQRLFDRQAGIFPHVYGVGRRA